MISHHADTGSRTDTDTDELGPCRMQHERCCLAIGCRVRLVQLGADVAAYTPWPCRGDFQIRNPVALVDTEKVRMTRPTETFCTKPPSDV